MNQKAKQVFDYRASKGFSSGQSDEHQRRWSEQAWEHALKKGSYDRSREHLNFEIIRGGVIRPVDKSIRITERMSNVLKERGIKDPNEGLAEPKYRTCVNIILGGSRERMNEMAFGDQKVIGNLGADNSHLKRCSEIEHWALDMYNFVSAKWGEENIIGFYVHLDETNPHVHCTLLPIDKENRFAFKRMFAGRNIYDFKARTSELHTELAKVNEKWGLERGDNIVETGAKHRSTEEYRRSLSRECSFLEDKVENYRMTLEHLQADIRLADRRVKGLTTMVANLEEHKYELEEEIFTLNEELEAGKGNTEELKVRLGTLGQELQEVISKLAEKKGKLSDADEKLLSLRKEMEILHDHTERLRKNAVMAMDDMERQTQYKMAEALYDEICGFLHNKWPSLTEPQKALFEDTILEDIVSYGSKIMECGMLLMAGYTNHAVVYAQSCGGGGGDISNWGRNEDEDERAWVRRCMMAARRMMKPCSGKSIRKR